MLIRKKDRVTHDQSSECVVYEYPFEDTDINVAFVEVKGRYPSSGYVSNEIVKEILFINSGEGKVVVEDDEYEIHKGDMFLIHPNQKYFLEGDFEAIISCSPAWSPEQHKHLEEHFTSNT
ncbi:MAG: hypothetical protein S4CHLAM6_08380 [Chlamydiae bacterium]|nr:hypothetical protein [Chlamydiota bacterium]